MLHWVEKGWMEFREARVQAFASDRAWCIIVDPRYRLE
jgi:hypothetical protein